MIIIKTGRWNTITIVHMAAWFTESRAADFEALLYCTLITTDTLKMGAHQL